MLGAGKEHHHSVLGDRYGIDVSDDSERDAALVEGRQIDRVVADTVTGHDPEPAPHLNGRGRERLCADHQPVGLVDQRGITWLGDFLHVIVGEAVGLLEQGDSSRMELPGNQNMRHQYPPLEPALTLDPPVSSLNILTFASAAPASMRT